MVQTRHERSSSRQTDLLTVFDLRDPQLPRARGTAPLRVATAEPETPSGLSGTGLAVSGGFAYLARSALGVQVVDVRHADAPRLVGVLDTPSQALQITTAQDLIYVVDSVFGLQVIQGPGGDLTDMDGDGVIDVFDRFPIDAAEFQDTDGDGVGDIADPDDDNDGFSDAQEQQEVPPTDPLDPQSFPITLPPAGSATLVVDAASPLPAQARNGTPQAPYRSLTAALQVLRSGQAPQVTTLMVRPGTYAALTTGERFPLDFSGLAQLTLRGARRDTTVLDARFVDDVITAEGASHLIIDGVTLTQGVHGIEVFNSTAVTLRRSRSTGNNFDGGRFSRVGDMVVMDTVLDGNGEDGLTLAFSTTTATIRHNTLRHNDNHGIIIDFGGHAEVSGNVIENNVRTGLVVFQYASAIIVDNTVRNNQRNGIVVQNNSTAEITGNTITDHAALLGLRVRTSATATVTDNTFTHNLVDIGADEGSTAIITRNTMTDNLFGLLLRVQSSVELVDNTIASDVLGVRVQTNSTATLRGNVLTSEAVGLLVLGQGSSAVLHSGTLTGSTFAAAHVLGGATIAMGLDDLDEIRIVQNNGVGLLVEDDGSLVELHSDHIRFEANAGGNVVGPVVDVADTDGDGVGSAAEVVEGTDPAVADTDSDGLLDGFELQYSFDPLIPGDGSVNADGDGLSNETEQEAGTDPRNPDTDGDGLPDAIEINLHHTDALRSDTDGDGLDDGPEVQEHGTDPTRADSDDGGLGDGEEVLLTGLDPLQPADAASVVNLVTNGGFEAEGGSLTGWTQFNRTAGPQVTWFALSDTTSPRTQTQLPVPPEGVTAAIADAEPPSLLILTQEIDIPPAASVALGVDVLVISGIPFITPEAFHFELLDPDPSQQFRIDLLAPEAPILAVGNEVLAALFRTEADDPPVSGYRRLLFDLTPYAGQRVVLRFAHNQAGLGMVSGIDNVRLLATGVSP